MFCKPSGTTAPYAQSCAAVSVRESLSVPLSLLPAAEGDYPLSYVFMHMSDFSW